MVVMALVFLLACQTEAQQQVVVPESEQANAQEKPRASIDGRWFIEGNGFYGKLEIQLDSDGEIHGSIYDEPIVGKWNVNNGRFEFTRFRLGEGIQLWEGELKVDPQDSKAAGVLRGKYFSIAGPQYGESDKAYEWSGHRLAENGMYVGMPAITSAVAEFVSGPKSGKTICPVAYDRNLTKIAIYAKQLNAPVLSIVKSVDEIVAGNPRLSSSFVFLSHENTPTPSETEYEKSLAEIKKHAAANSIQHLSMGLMIRIPSDSKLTRAKPKLGIFGDVDLVVMLIGPEKTGRHTVVQHFQVLSSESVDSQKDRICNDLKRAIEKIEK